jgi:hypothetical protein
MNSLPFLTCPYICQMVLGLQNLLIFSFTVEFKLKACSLVLTKKEGTWQHWDETKMNSQVRV